MVGLLGEYASRHTAGGEFHGDVLEFAPATVVFESASEPKLHNTVRTIGSVGVGQPDSDGWVMHVTLDNTGKGH